MSKTEGKLIQAKTKKEIFLSDNTQIEMSLDSEKHYRKHFQKKIFKDKLQKIPTVRSQKQKQFREASLI